MPHRRALWSYWLTFALVSLYFTSSVLSARVNVTVDDSGVDSGAPHIIYLPQGEWNVGNNCSECTAQPTSKDAFAGTWHDTTFPADGTKGDLRTASLAFNGSAIYVFCILAHSYTSPTSTSDMTFYIDGNVVGNFVSSPDGTTGYTYNYPVYSNASLNPGPHSFTLQGGHVGGVKSLILLDYIVYSQDFETLSTAPPPNIGSYSSYSIPHTTVASFPNSTQLGDSQSVSSHHTRTVAIAAAVPTCIVVLAMIVAGIIFYRLKRNRRRPSIFEPPAESNITEDPSSSGWVDGAFGRQAGSALVEHPSLTPKGSIPEGLRGDPTTRGVPKFRRDRSMTESSSASTAARIEPSATRIQSRRPSILRGASSAGEGSSGSSVAIEMTKMSGSSRHPYAAPTPEPDIEPIVDEDNIRQPGSRTAEKSTYVPGPSSSSALSSPSGPQVVPPISSVGSPATSSIRSNTRESPLIPSSSYPIVRPAAARQRSNTRPLPTRPILESQAHAARLRRQNSASAASSSPSPAIRGDAPPPYELSKATHRPQ